MNQAKLLFNTHRVIPVVALNDVTQAIQLAQALSNGGILVMEVTLRTPNALHIIKTLTQEMPHMQIGAGTAITVQQYQQAVNQGAKFVISPGLNQEVINFIDNSQQISIPYIPGVITPSEVIAANNANLSALKFFPANGFDALQMLSSYQAVFPSVSFCVTGGVSLNNMGSYLALSNVDSVGCSFLANQDLLNKGDFVQIGELAKQAVEIAASIKNITYITSSS